MKIDRIGQRFGQLTVIEAVESEKRKDGHGTFSRWKCICDCGKETIVRSNCLISGVTKSCGCLKGKVPQCLPRLPIGEGGFLRVYRGYLFGSAQRKLTFELSIDDFRKLTKQNCHYCGTAPSKIMSTGHKLSEYLYNGIDRKDNTLGYTIDNCLPCCETCNKAKWTKTYQDFMNWIDMLVKYTITIKNN